MALLTHETVRDASALDAVLDRDPDVVLDEIRYLITDYLLVARDLAAKAAERFGVEAVDAKIEAGVGETPVGVGPGGEEASDFGSRWTTGSGGDGAHFVAEVVVKRVSAAAGVAMGEGEEMMEHRLRRERGVG